MDITEVAANRRRLYVMLGVVGACFLIAAALVAAYVQTRESWMLGAIAAVIVAGFAAQGWMIVRFVQTGKPKP